jgi:hypothetical protein
MMDSLSNQKRHPKHISKLAGTNTSHAYLWHLELVAGTQFEALFMKWIEEARAYFGRPANSTEVCRPY